MALVVHGAATEKSEPVNAVTTEYCYSLDPVIRMEKYPHLQLYVHFKRKFKHQKRRAILPYFETPAKYITKANFNGNVMEVS